MIIVTGGAGFIGSNLVKRLNERGITDILLVDNLTNTDKIPNLSDLRIADYMDKQAFLTLIEAQTFLGRIDAIFHQGACSDTMVSDGRYVMENNYRYSQVLHRYALSQRCPFIYASSASVYGGGTVFIESEQYESVLNAYAYSKLLFDNYMRRYLHDSVIPVVGLRYFNVYGAREAHKGRMASVAYHFFNQYQQNQQVKLFQGSGGYGDGGQIRDFVYVDDVVDVNLFFLDNPQISGIYNVGTGQGQTFNEVALATVNTLRKREGKEALDLSAAVSQGVIEYIPMPDQLQGKYQSYTQADISALRQSGYDGEFSDVSEGVEAYISQLANS